MNEVLKNDNVEIKITGMTSEGCGVGRHCGLAVFVANTIPGETVRAHIIKAKKNYAIGKCSQVVEASEHRVESECEAFSRCGGCALRHIDYAEECRIKQETVRDNIRKIGGIDVAVDDIVSCEKTDFYRNKAQYPVRIENGELKIGFFAPRSHRIVGAEGCRLQYDGFGTVLKCFREWILKCKISVYDEKTGKGELRHIYLRRAHATGEVMVCAVINSKELSSPEYLLKLLEERVEGLKSVVVNYNTQNTNVILGERCETIWGREWIEDILCGKRLRISARSFYQVNSEQAEKLYAIAAEYADLHEGDRLVDIYCGIGSVGLSMADKVGELIGFEIVPEAVKNAKDNAKLNGIFNAEFFCADAGTALKRIKLGGRIDVVVIDPPRKGCDTALIEDISKASPERVVYISCDSATLARDLKIFREHGYATKRVTPVDMFPRTAHVETVCLLEQEKF